MPREPRGKFLGAFDVSRETMERLDIYEKILREWSTRLSLVGRKTLDDIWERHFLDSAQLWPWIDSRCVLDIGTGAGFPGMVLAIMGAPDIHLSDNNQQKIAFLHEVAEKTGTAVTIHNSKAESLASHGVEIVTARAVAPLERLLAMASPFFSNGAEGLFLKGRNASAEIGVALRNWNFDLESAPSLTSPESSILHLRRIQPKA
jgi:16S rRNA (guanine527-N7)-methyltransferase